MPAALKLIELRKDVGHADLRRPLSPVMQTALDYIRQCIREQRQVTQVGIMHAIGSENTTGSTSAGVLKRLEKEGYITRTIYQRGVQVCDVESGQCSPQPPCLATHWRLRPEKIATMPSHELRRRSQPAAHVIEHEARRIGMTLQDFQMQLILNGLELWLEKESGDE